MLLRDPVDTRALLSALFGKLQQIPHFIEREPQVPAAADEAETRHVLVFVHPVVSLRPGGNRQETDLFVIADRHHLDPGGLGQFSDAQAPLEFHSLDPIVTIDPILEESP